MNPVIAGLELWSTLRMLMAAAAVCVLVAMSVAAYRYVQRASPMAARLLASGIILRAVAGVCLFFISLFRLPFFRALQLGDGFWSLARDGQTYFHIAATATQRGLGTIVDSLPSPFFLRVLACWLWLFGAEPPTALLLNVACYTGSIVLIVFTASRVRFDVTAGNALAVPVAAITFSPALLIYGTQPVKDPLCVLLLLLATASVAAWWPAAARDHRAGILAAGTGVLAAVYGVAGIRPYLALFIVVAFALASLYRAVIFRFEHARIRPLLDAALAISLLPAFILGSGPYAEGYRSLAWAVVRHPAAPFEWADSLRSGFVATGGDTSIAAAATDKSEAWDKAGTAMIGDTLTAHTTGGRLVNLTLGLATMFVPISLLQRASIVTFSGGRGLLAVTDLDTLIFDAAILWSAWLVWSATRKTGLEPLTVFVIVTALLGVGSLSYIVTNFGTLFRLRMIAVIPLAIAATTVATQRARIGLRF